MEWVIGITFLFSAQCVCVFLVSSENTGNNYSNTAQGNVVNDLPVCVPHQYYFVNEEKSWADAQSYCRENYSDLVTINNMEEMNLINTLKGKATGTIWIGLQRRGDGEWQWSLKNPQNQTYRNWCSNSPNQFQLTESCIQIKKCGCWTDQSCVTQNPFVCYNGTEGQDRYILITEHKSWYDAQRYCREHHTGLVSVRNQSENEQIQNVINSSSDPVWIGLFNTSWKWSDGSDSCFRNWESEQPNSLEEKCVALSMTGSDTVGQWHDLSCESNFPFICHNNSMGQRPIPGLSNSTSQPPDKLILIKLNMTWTEALRYCRDHHVDLVSVQTEEIKHGVMKLVEDASTEHVWMGLGYTCILDFWYWVTGEPFCYQNWAPGNGRGEEDCSHGDRFGAVQSGGEKQWVSLTVHQKLNFICTK